MKATHSGNLAQPPSVSLAAPVERLLQQLSGSAAVYNFLAIKEDNYEEDRSTREEEEVARNGIVSWRAQKAFTTKY